MSAKYAEAVCTIPSGLNERDYAAFQRIAKSAAGIELAASKRSMIYTRFIRRLRELGISSFSDYIDLVERPGSREFECFVNTVTTNLTYFFREPHHFEYLKETVIPEVYQDRLHAAPVRIWSAGCSNGAEPYSIALTFAEAGKLGESDYRLLCTDIDSNMVAHTATGIFSEPDTRGLNANQKKNWFDPVGNGKISAKSALKKGMICKQHNLFKYWPIKPRVDIIFCRNVLIYFNKPDQKKIIRSFGSVQSSGQYLFLGHSESLHGFDDIYRRVANTVYRRV